MAKHEELMMPIFSSLELVYSEGSPLEKVQLLSNHLRAKFQEVFGHAPDLFARSSEFSGIVNLISEHIDYKGYSVLPIRQDAIIAIRKHDGDASKSLRIANVNDKYTMCTYPADLQRVKQAICIILLGEGCHLNRRYLFFVPFL